MRFGVQFASLLTLVSIPLVAHADLEKLRPSWTKPADVATDPNCSYLNDRLHRDDPSFLSTLLDDRRSAEMRQDYRDMNRDYELKSHYGLTGMADEQSHLDQASGFARGATNQIQRVQLDRTAKDLKASAEQHPDIAKPAEVVGGAAAVATGSTVGMHVTDDMLLQSKTNLARQRGEFNLFSSVVNASVQVNMLIAANQDPTVPVSPDPMARDERYRVMLTRGLPLWDLSSALSYGSTSSSLNASVSKRITDNLTAVVDSSRLPDRNAGTVKLNYGIRF